jgi:excisionase family DNA binding protein
MKNDKSLTAPLDQETYSTMEAARMLGLAVRSVQLMVDRQELEAWKTPGGHRRIARASLESWIRSRGASPQAEEPTALSAAALPKSSSKASSKILLIEDSVHFQNLVALLVRQHFPQAELHVAHDGITGLAICGQQQPDVLLVDILLPGIDGATLITALRSQPQFANSRLIVLTSLDEAARGPYAFALQGVDVIHKPNLVKELPALLSAALRDKADGHV